MKIKYALVASPFGKCLIGASENKVCFLSFVDKVGKKFCEDKILAIWPGATLLEDGLNIKKVGEKIFKGNYKSEVLLKGSEFEKKVWKALIEIPYGETSTYKKIATKVGSAKASRAVGSACKHNPIPYIVPCHRVKLTSGQLGQYNGGIKLKQRMLDAETKLSSNK